MKITLLGGGGLRNLPVIRELLKLKNLNEKSEIVLYDLSVDRAETMAAMAGKTPEWRHNPVRISVSENLEEALDKASFVYFAIRQASKKSRVLSGNACMEHGLIGYPDNLTVRGSVSAAWNIPIILKVARIMEKVAPEAWLFIFTNPISVLTSAVHQATGIKAVGVCAGFANHNYDLPRIMNWPVPDFDFETDVAGVNHCSWILRCRYRGEDFFPMLDRRPAGGAGFGHLEYIRKQNPALHRSLMFALPKMLESHQMFGGMLYSSEPDGLPHICYYNETLKYQRRFAEKLPSAVERSAAAREWDEFAGYAREEKLPDSFWDSRDRSWKSFEHPKGAIGVRMIRGLSGETEERLVASFPNRGAIRNIPDDMLMEYSMIVSENSLKPAGTYQLPDGLGGVMRSLAEHQFLVARSICNQNRREFMEAMYAYPLLRSKCTVDSLIPQLIEINREQMPAFLLEG